jgi:hypothetical protein
MPGAVHVDVDLQDGLHPDGRLLAVSTEWDIPEGARLWVESAAGASDVVRLVVTVNDLGPVD